MNTPSVYSLTQQDWTIEFSGMGTPVTVLPFWLDGLYKDPRIWEKHISSRLIERLKSQFDFNLPAISHCQEAQDGTVKFLMKFSDGLEVETVLIPFHKRFTVCLSTQVGCGMNCSFCYTGTQGLKRNLTSGEIVGQYLVASGWLRKKDPNSLKPSIVFMGQGEPLHNFAEVKQAIKVLNDTKTIGIGRSQMTLSTVGYLPGLKKISELPRVNLALSLHSPFDTERVKLIPVNQRYPLDEVLEALDEVQLTKSQFITYEYLLIKNLNMTDDHVEELHKLLGHRKAILNLIPFNPFPGSHWERPNDEEINQFKDRLVGKKLRAMIRTTKGADILAACGQLKVVKLARQDAKY